MSPLPASSSTPLLSLSVPKPLIPAAEAPFAPQSRHALSSASLSLSPPPLFPPPILRNASHNNNASPRSVPHPKQPQHIRSAAQKFFLSCLPAQTSSKYKTQSTPAFTFQYSSLLNFARNAARAPFGNDNNYPSPASYRAAICKFSPSSIHRLVRLSSGTHYMTATPTGGDCGFIAVTWALLHLRSETFTPQHVRKILSNHVKHHSAYYTELLRRQDLVQSPQNATEAVAQFTTDVLKGGVDGHWLGQMWGEIELLAIAKAFVVTLDLYCFDVASQRLRSYARFDEGKTSVNLLFTGDATAGHFDVLLSRKRHKWPFAKTKPMFNS